MPVIIRKHIDYEDILYPRKHSDELDMRLTQLELEVEHMSAAILELYQMLRQDTKQ